jgi:hypothetical protein
MSSLLDSILEEMRVRANGRGYENQSDPTTELTEIVWIETKNVKPWKFLNVQVPILVQPGHSNAAVQSFYRSLILDG